MNTMQTIRYEDLPDIVTPQQAAEYLGLHVKTVYTYIHEGRIRAVPTGKKYKLRKEWLIDFLEEPVL